MSKNSISAQKYVLFLIVTGGTSLLLNKLVYYLSDCKCILLCQISISLSHMRTYLHALIEVFFPMFPHKCAGFPVLVLPGANKSLKIYSTTTVN